MGLLKLQVICLILLFNTSYGVANDHSGSLDSSDPENSIVAYCDPVPTTYWTNYITEVTFGSIVNTNQADKKSGSFNPAGVGDYTAMSTDISAGNVYPLNITARYKYYTNTPEEGYLRVWIDFNGDDDFDDAGELVVDHLETIIGNNQPNPTYYNITKNIAVPANATAGESRMRIAIYRDDTPVPPCPSYAIDGEFEKYSVMILNGVDTSPPIPNLTTSNNVVSGLFSMNVDFNETVTGLTVDDFNVTNGTASNLQGSGLNYTLDITPSNVGVVAINLPANKVEDGAGNLNTVSNTLSVDYLTNPPEAYCIPGSINPYNNYINGVSFGNIDNLNQQPEGEAKSANNEPFGYHDYTSLVTTVEAGSTYEVDVTALINYYGPPSSGKLRAWIDFNMDGDFDDAGELSVDSDVTITQGMNGTNYAFNENITIPVGSSIGNTRMRLLISHEPNPQGPCEANSFKGEYEDYSLNILPIGSTADQDCEVVWATCPANVLMNSCTEFEKFYNNPFEYYRGCNLLPANEDGWLEFTLLDDVFNNGDWFYIGLIEKDKTIVDNGTFDPNFLIAVRSNTLTPNENILILENEIKDIRTGGNQNETYKISRENGVVKYFKGDELIYTHVPAVGTNPNDLELEPVLYILDPGSDNLTRVDIKLSDNFLCTEFEIEGHYTKQEATPSSGGAIKMDIGGGTPPYTFEWSSTELVGPNPVNVPAGTHMVTVTDAGGLTKSEEIDIYEMHDIEWETVESGVNQTGDTYILSDLSNNELFSCNVIDANATALIKIRLNEDVIPSDSTPYNEFNVFFKDTEFRTDALGKYGFKLNIFGSVLLVDDQQYNQASPEVFGPDLFYNSKAYEYTIQLKNRKVRFYKNQKFLYEADILAEIENLRVEFNLISSEADGVDVDIQVSDKCVPPLNVAQFVDLKRQLDGSYIQVEDDYIRFRYNEDYAVIDGPDSNLECKIFDWRRNERYAISLNKEYGVNWRELKIPDGGLVNNEVYILEVYNANKGETYYLRFKYKCPPGVPCAG